MLESSARIVTHGPVVEHVVQAYRHTRARRRAVFPNVGFLRALIEFERELMGAEATPSLPVEFLELCDG